MFIWSVENKISFQTSFRRLKLLKENCIQIWDSTSANYQNLESQILGLSYFQSLIRITRHMHPFGFRQVHVTADYHRYSIFPMTVFFFVLFCFFSWNRLSAVLATLGDIDSFQREVGKINRQCPWKVTLNFFILLLTSFLLTYKNIVFFTSHYHTFNLHYVFLLLFFTYHLYIEGVAV